MVICLERDADLHMAQLMPLLLTVSCFSKIQTGFIFLVTAHPGSLGKRAVKHVCVCTEIILFVYLLFCMLLSLYSYLRKPCLSWITVLPAHLLKYLLLVTYKAYCTCEKSLCLPKLEFIIEKRRKKFPENLSSSFSALMHESLTNIYMYIFSLMVCVCVCSVICLISTLYP